MMELSATEMGKTKKGRFGREENNQGKPADTCRVPRPHPDGLLHNTGGVL